MERPQNSEFRIFLKTSTHVFINNVWESTCDFDTYYRCRKPPKNAHADVSSSVRGLIFGLATSIL